MLRSAILLAVLFRCCLHRQYVAGLGWSLEKPGFSSVVLVAAEGSWTHWELGLAVPLLHQMELLYHGSQPEKKKDCWIKNSAQVFFQHILVYMILLWPRLSICYCSGTTKRYSQWKPNPTTVILLLTREAKNNYLFNNFQFQIWYGATICINNSMLMNRKTKKPIFMQSCFLFPHKNIYAG